MGARLTDSALYGHLWGSDEARAVFEERGRLASWLEILAALAAAQAELGLVPQAAATAIAAVRVEDLDLDAIAAETRRTGHSTLGLIRGLQAVLPPHAAEHVYAGATVQDLTDTWTAVAIRHVGALLWRDLRALEDDLLTLAQQHRDTLVVGRTHGQPGSVITIGFKAASWADEVRRHLDRLRQGAPRWLVAQLGGAVGSLAFFGSHGLELRQRFAARLELGDPGISWLTARDRIAEFTHLLAMVAATLARIGGEVYQLQRPEIGELAEPPAPGAVGSITMPHKRNPERSEHLVTLSRLVRANAAVCTEGMSGEHERDGRSWKAEWPAFDETCLLTCQACALARELVAGLQVDEAACARGVATGGGYAAAEQVLAALTPRLGKHRAQDRLQSALAAGRAAGLSLAAAVVTDPELRAALHGADLDALTTPDAGLAAVMADAVVARACAARAAEPRWWPA